MNKSMLYNFLNYYKLAIIIFVFIFAIHLSPFVFIGMSIYHFMAGREIRGIISLILVVFTVWFSYVNHVSVCKAISEIVEENKK